MCIGWRRDSAVGRPRCICLHLGTTYTFVDEPGPTSDVYQGVCELEAVGFERVARYDWRDTEHAEIDDYSQAYVPHMDKDNGTLVSLNVQAYKPAES